MLNLSHFWTIKISECIPKMNILMICISLPMVPLFSKSPKLRVLPNMCIGRTDIKNVGDFFKKVTFFSTKSILMTKWYYVGSTDIIRFQKMLWGIFPLIYSLNDTSKNVEFSSFLDIIFSKCTTFFSKQDNKAVTTHFPLHKFGLRSFKNPYFISSLGINLFFGLHQK